MSFLLCGLIFDGSGWPSTLGARFHCRMSRVVGAAPSAYIQQAAVDFSSRLLRVQQPVVLLSVEHHLLEGRQLLPHAAAFAVRRRDREARSHRPDAQDLRHEDAGARGAHYIHCALRVEHADPVLHRVGGVDVQLLAGEELGRRAVEPLAVGAAVGRRRVGGGADAAVGGDRLTGLRGCLALVLEPIRVPLEQRREVDDLERDRVAPLLQEGVARLVVAHFHRRADHLLARVHRHEEVGVGEAAMADLATHRVAEGRAEPAVVVGGVERPVVAAVHVRLVLERLDVERRVGLVAAVVVLARHAGHQRVEQAVVTPAAHPLVRVGLVELEAGGARFGVLAERAALREARSELVDHSQTVERQVAGERVAEDAVVPLRDGGRAAVVGDDGGREEGIVLEAALAAAVPREAHLLLQVAPRVRVDRMPVADERLTERVGRRPRRLQVAQQRAEVGPVVAAAGGVLVAPRAEPLAHLAHLIGDRRLREHLGRHGRVGDVDRLAVRADHYRRLHQHVVIVASAELHPVEHGDQLAHAERAHVVGVVVHRHDGGARVRLGVVRPVAAGGVPDLLDARVAVGPDALLRVQLLHDELAREDADRLLELLGRDGAGGGRRAKEDAAQGGQQDTGPRRRHLKHDRQGPYERHRGRPARHGATATASETRQAGSVWATQRAASTTRGHGDGI